MSRTVAASMASAGLAIRRAHWQHWKQRNGPSLRHSRVSRHIATATAGNYRPGCGTRLIGPSGMWRHVIPLQSQGLVDHSYGARPYLLSCPTALFHTANANRGKVVVFNLADIGEGITEVVIKQWMVKEGDKVKQFDYVAEVQSDKAAVEISSPHDGIVKKLYYEEDDTAFVGKPLMDIEVAGEDNDTHSVTTEPAAEPKATISSTASAQPHSPAARTSGVNDMARLATPAVRRIAKENNLNLGDIVGTGKDGRIMKEDVLAHMDGSRPTRPDDGVGSRTPTGPAAPQTTTTPSDIVQDTTVSLNPFQKGMVKSMTAALQVPHFGYSDEVQVDALVPLRSQILPIFHQRLAARTEEYTDKKPPNFTNMSFFIKAASLALHSYPILNASLHAPASADSASWSLTYHAHHHIGVAMDTPMGLVVPVIRHVEQRSLSDVALELARLASLARRGQLTQGDMTGGTITLSNIGVIGGTYAQPILVTPQVCIAAFGKVQEVPRYDAKGHVVPVKQMQVSWSADHRIIDGATMARFSNLWKSYIEQPGLFLLDMSA